MDFYPRLGSCGALIDVPVGTVVAPKGSIAVTRNYDFDFVTGKSDELPYRTSKPVSSALEFAAYDCANSIVVLQVSADPMIHDAVSFKVSSCKSRSNLALGRRGAERHSSR